MAGDGIIWSEMIKLKQLKNLTLTWICDLKYVTIGYKGYSN